MSLKRFIFDKITKLPSFLLFPLIRLNNNPQRIFGNEFAVRYKFLQEVNISKASLEKQLIEVTNHAIKMVPFYSATYHGLKIESIEDFYGNIDFIDKETILGNFEDFLSVNIELDKYELQTTGGTSGRPLKIYQPKDRYKNELASVYYAWSKVGYNFDLRAVMRNHKMEKGQIFQINPITKEIQFNNFNNEDCYLTEVYNTIIKYKIQYFHSYPSAAYQFVMHCKKNNFDLSFLKAFLCSSENILDVQRQLIEKEFGIKLFAFYGHTEKLVFASNCAKSDLYHVDQAYGFFELINKNGDHVKLPGEIGEIVGSTFTNKGMPLIRYKTGDFAEYYGDVCPNCGEKTTILKNILGRWNGDKIFNKDGTNVTVTSLNLHGDLYTHIEGLQYYQPSNGILEVRIIKADTFNQQHEIQLIKEIGNKFNSDLDLIINFVNELEFQPNGKFLQLIRKKHE
jgi:phenylacetate-CoA ligase